MAYKLQEHVLIPLHQSLKDGVGDALIEGWSLHMKTHGHGYCKLKTSWVYATQDASNRTGSVPRDFEAGPAGLLHPNVYGHDFYSQLICERLLTEFGLNQTHPPPNQCRYPIEERWNKK